MQGGISAQVFERIDPAEGGPCFVMRSMRYMYLSFIRKPIMAVSLRLPEDLAIRLDKIARRTKTYYMIEAIREQIGDLEDLYLAEKRLARIKSGKSKTVPLSEVMKDYGMES
jgi:RHH-type transcriptional regulator, rel operon repressor / antitoxin RelB